jgi:hypothetical protein
VVDIAKLSKLLWHRLSSMLLLYLDVLDLTYHALEAKHALPLLRLSGHLNL